MYFLRIFKCIIGTYKKRLNKKQTRFEETAPIIPKYLYNIGIESKLNAKLKIEKYIGNFIKPKAFCIK
jgi:hypothetical protein